MISRLLCTFSLFMVLTAASVLEAEGQGHPTIFVDTGACPGEGCRYGKWKVQKETVLYTKPDKRSKRVGKCKPGSEVIALTGEVHTIAGKFTVKKKHEKFNPGDTIWVYTYYGEGYFKVWFDGKFTEEHLYFSPWGGSAGSRCEKKQYCWGELEDELNFTWWVQIQMADSIIGWTSETKNFDY